MWKTVTMGVLTVSSLVGCMPQPRVAEVAEPEPLALIEAKPVCEEKPPVRIEVPVPVPLPCQLQPPPPAPQPKLTRVKGRAVKGVAQANEAARQGPSDAQWVNAVQQFTYMPGALYQVYAAIGKVTTVSFPQGETIASYAVGDSALKTQQPESHDVLYLMPEVPDVRTNVTVRTTKRQYLLEVHVTESTYMASVSWAVPELGGIVVENPVPVAQAVPETPLPALTMGIVPEKLNFGYTISGKQHPTWQPVRVFDDGSKTYLQFPATLSTGDAPVLFIRSPENTVELVNYRVKGNFYILDRLADYMELRVGEKSPIIVKIQRQPQTF